jgi:hypothetical protein
LPSSSALVRAVSSGVVRLTSPHAAQDGLHQLPFLLGGLVVVRVGAVHPVAELAPLAGVDVESGHFGARVPVSGGCLVVRGGLAGHWLAEEDDCGRSRNYMIADTHCLNYPDKDVGGSLARTFAASG